MLQTCRQQGHICHRVFSWSELTLFLLAHGGGLSLLGVRHHLFGREVHLSHLCNAQLRRASPEGGNKRGQRNKQTKQTDKVKSTNEKAARQKWVRAQRQSQTFTQPSQNGTTASLVLSGNISYVLSATHGNTEKHMCAKNYSVPRLNETRIRNQSSGLFDTGWSRKWSTTGPNGSLCANITYLNEFD